MRTAATLAAACLALAFAGCTTTTMPSARASPVPPSRIFAPEFTQAREGLALLVVTRDKGLRSQGCSANLYLDGVRVADLRPTEQVRLFVEEGEHLVGVIADGALCFGGSSQATADVTRARPYLLRIRSSNGPGVRIERSAF